MRAAKPRRAVGAPRPGQLLAPGASRDGRLRPGGLALVNESPPTIWPACWSLLVRLEPSTKQIKHPSPKIKPTTIHHPAFPISEFLSLSRLFLCFDFTRFLYGTDCIYIRAGASSGPIIFCLCRPICFLSAHFDSLVTPGADAVCGHGWTSVHQ